MKKNVFVAIALIAAAGLANSAKAQTKPAAVKSSQVSQVEVTVNLKDVIGVGNSNVNSPGSKAISFTLETADDYSQDKTQVVPAQFTVTSSQPYDVMVRTSGQFEGADPAGKATVNLDADILQVRARKVGDVYGSKVSLSTSDQPVLSAVPAAVNQIFDVEYTLTKTKTLLAAPKTSYKTNVIYTVAYK